MTKKPWKIPSSWEWSVIGNLGDVVSGGTPSTKISKYWGGDVAWFAPSDLTGYDQKFIDRGAKTLTSEGVANSSAKVMDAGSLMFSSRAPIGYVAINSVPAATNQGFKSIVPYNGLFNEYLYYYLKSAKQIAEERASGTTFKELSATRFKSLPVPIAPTSEQHRIVTKIDVLFEEIDKGIASLKSAKKLIQLYRQSLLKSAFEGRLTAKWREENVAKNLEDARNVLLARIRDARDSGDMYVPSKTRSKAVSIWKRTRKKQCDPQK